MASDKIHLIVTGVARSGTTALAELLNSHDRVCIGIERFKFQFLLRNTYSADLFERERFFDFRKEDTNLRPDVRPHWQDVYDGITRKWEKAAVIGDKVPDLTPVLADFMDANPDFKYIYILRNLKDVALSWKARADRSRDAWPSGKGFAAACDSWAAQMKDLTDLLSDKRRRRNMLLLDYDTMYAEGARTEATILGFLGLGADASFAETFARHREFAASRANRKVPGPLVETYKAVDMSLARGLRKGARTQAEHWADIFDKKVQKKKAKPQKPAEA